jgi:uncharacterized membrane protein (DUF2068 family)
MTELVDEVKKRVDQEIHRPDFGLRVIIVWKTIKGVFLLAVAILAFIFRDYNLHDLMVDFVSWLGIDPAGPRVGQVLAQLTGLTPIKVGIGALAISALMFVEAWGLHRRRVWAEWLTVIATSSLIPVEIYHLAKHPSLGKVLTLVANVAIVLYLLRHRWLFVPGRVERWWRARHPRHTKPSTPPSASPNPPSIPPSPPSSPSSPSL